MAYKDDRRYMTFEMRAEEDAKYRGVAPKMTVAERRAAYYHAVEMAAKARKARDVEAFHRYTAVAREHLAKLP